MSGLPAGKDSLLLVNIGFACQPHLGAELADFENSDNAKDILAQSDKEYATAQSLISGKWAILIMHYLEDGSIRFNELQRLMPKMTHATLSVQLKALVDNGLVERKQYESIPPKVEYSLTEIGKKFRPVIDALQNWGYEYTEYLQKDKE